MNFKEDLHRRIEEVEAVVLDYLPRPEGCPSRLIEAMNYSMTAGGKRLRPLLMRESYALFGGKGRVVEPFMAAMEMIHTHSLIHDDLPAIDNDLYRRGKKTTHSVYGEALGVLSGDALLNYAYETALRAFSLACSKGEEKDRKGESGQTEFRGVGGGDDPEQMKRSLRALQILADKTGIYGMLGGQSVDVENEKNDILTLPQSQLDYIYRNKTSALLEAPLMMGAVLAGAGEAELTCMEQVGTKVGLAFQIRDDILDVESSQEELGKPVFSDEKNHKTTYVTLLGVEGASGRVGELTAEAIQLLEALPGKTEEKTFLKQLFLYLVERKK